LSCVCLGDVFVLFAVVSRFCVCVLVAFCRGDAWRVVGARLASSPLVSAVFRVVVYVCSFDRDCLGGSGARDCSFEDSSSDGEVSVERAERIVATCLRGLDVETRVSDYHFRSHFFTLSSGRNRNRAPSTSTLSFGSPH